MIYMRYKIEYFLIVVLLFSALFSCESDNALHEQQRIDYAQEIVAKTGNDKPWSYWWWMGSAVDKRNIEYNLRKYKEAGLGGLHIVPIYGVRGEEGKFIDYLSEEWIEMLSYTKRKADELGLGLDMTLGTGWCFGGRGVDVKTGSMLSSIERLIIPGGQITRDLTITEQNFEMNKIQSALSIGKDGQRIDISAFISDDQILSWDCPYDSVEVYILRIFGPVFKVKRPAPGGEGFMLDPFSVNAVNNYTARFDSAFNDSLNNYVRSIYHDSYEYKADWTHDLFDTFEVKRGYDLRNYLPELLGVQSENAHRIIADYRQTMAELHESYIKRTKEWADTNGVLFRNQGHGSPANWLDVYALADIPETETFGATKYQIPGWTREEQFINDDVPNRFVLKFASSAAHVTGKPLVSSETNTWLREHFRVALSHSKPELDQLFLSGINHIFYHGIAYSPEEADWPGWQFYASTSFAPTNSIFDHFSAQNKYAESIQAALRSGKADNDILLYYPIQDIWHTPIKMGNQLRSQLIKGEEINSTLKILYKLTAHNYEDWLLPYPLYDVALTLDSLGFSFDYISDKQLMHTSVIDGEFVTSGNNYKTLVIPKTTYMPIRTMRAIEDYTKNGGKVIFIDELPQSVPGYHKLKEREQQLEQQKNTLITHENINIVKLKNQNDLSALLTKCGSVKELLASAGLPYIKRKTDNGHIYFMSNIYAGRDINEFIPLGVKAKQVVFTDPVTGVSGLAQFSEKEGMWLQLDQGKSLIIKTFDDEVIETDQNPWKYEESRLEPIVIKGTWQVEFIKGGPNLPKSYHTSELTSWTESADPESKRFAGTAKYSIEFNLENRNADEYLLSFDQVKESVLVRINGQKVTTLFAHPFETYVGDYLRDGVNRFEFEVANLAANRIRDLDLQGVDWKKFYDINFVNIDYRPFDASGWEVEKSGLIGEVQLIPIIIK
jgi:hypothetical protein